MVELLLIAVAVFAYALASRPLSMSVVSAPMVYTTVGLVIGGAGSGWFDLRPGGETISVVVEATLVLVLFTDAARMSVPALRHDVAIPARLLGIGLPLTLLAGAVAAALTLGVSWAGALLLAAVLTPTDAALGQAVVSDERLPTRVRQSLNVESGLNDGLMVPIVTVAIALAASEEDPGRAAGGWVSFAAQQILVGLVCGVLIGLVGGALLRRRAEQGRVESVYRQLATLSVAAGAYAAAELLGGNGFVAAFIAGMVFGVVAGAQSADVAEFTQVEGDLLTAITFVVFGAVLIPPALSTLAWPVIGYVVLSLTVVRIVPVLLALTGSGLLMQTRLFLGWFGPRGLASILFALLVAQQVDGEEAALIVDVATWAVLASVYAHGCTATPWAGWLGARLEAASSNRPEKTPSVVRPTRRSVG